MTATGHALIGTLIAAKVSNPFFVVIFSFFSHFAGDILPHWDSGTHARSKTKKRIRIEAAADVLVGFLLSFVLYAFFLKQNNFGLLIISILAAQALDWLSAPPFMFNMHIPVLEQIYQIQRKLNVKLDKPWGIVTQIGAIVAFYIVLFGIPGY